MKNRMSRLERRAVAFVIALALSPFALIAMWNFHVVECECGLEASPIVRGSINRFAPLASVIKNNP